MKRIAIPQKVRDEILMKNRHMCCVCQETQVQIHHIDANPSNNTLENLAVLCLKHHDDATAPKRISAKLSINQILNYKRDWEELCRLNMHKMSRSRTGFYMVNYKNADRIRQLFLTLPSEQIIAAKEILKKELMEENNLRDKQGYLVSMEPTLKMDDILYQLYEELGPGNIHPKIFRDSRGHPKDPMYPSEYIFQSPNKYYYDIWCQLLMRIIVICRETYSIEDLMMIENLDTFSASGFLMSFKGRFRGDVAFPDDWENKPITKTLIVSGEGFIKWYAEITLHTHYIYSNTASDSLSRKNGNGIMLFDEIEKIERKNKIVHVKYNAKPLIIGNGMLNV